MIATGRAAWTLIDNVEVFIEETRGATVTVTVPGVTTERIHKILTKNCGGLEIMTGMYFLPVIMVTQ